MESIKTFDPVNYNILIIEDSISINKMLSNKFKELNYNCYDTFTLKEAYEVLETTKIDYVMLDLNLPDGNGLKVIEKLEDSATKIFILTVENNKAIIEDTYKKGIIDFIPKDKHFFHKIDDITSTIERLEKNRLSTILIVDDSKVIQTQLSELLINRHYNIKLSDNAQNAYEIIQKENINLILLDIELKSSNGLNFLKENKVEIINKRRIPVIMISGQVNSSTIRDSLKEGAVDILQKPFVKEEIILKVDLWVDYKRKESEIEKSTKLLKQYKDTVDRSSLVYKTNPEGHITYVNDEFCKISEYQKEELLGEELTILKHNNKENEFFKKIWSEIEEKKKPWKGKIKNRKKSGKIFWTATIINPILDSQNNIIEYINISKDVTHDELVQEFFKNQLNSSNENLEHAITKADEYKKAMYQSNIVSRTDLKGNIIFVNDEFCKISGFTDKELIGQSHNIVRHKDMKPEVFNELWETIQNGKVWKGIIKNCNKSGGTYWVNTTIVPIRDKDNTIIEYMSIRNDLTELFELHDEIENTQKEIIYRMGEIGETRSNETGNHVKRVALYSKLLASLYGLDEEIVDLLFTASPMHDIGKVGIPDAILKKPEALSKEEFDLMKKHAEIGYNILKGSQRKVLKAASIVSYEHHEKWNGSGYPRGLKGEEIHIFGRITAVADVFDALGTKRCYKNSWTDEKILEYFKEEKGKSFDPKLIDLLFQNKEEFFKIKNKYLD